MIFNLMFVLMEYSVFTGFVLNKNTHALIYIFFDKVGHFDTLLVNHIGTKFGLERT